MVSVARLQRAIKESVQYRHDPYGSAINLTTHLFSRDTCKLVNKNSNVIPVYKVNKFLTQDFKILTD